MAYIKGERKPVTGCVFCNKVDADDAVEQVVARSEYVYVTLNRFPYNNGHLMVVPYEHVPTQEDLSEAALTDLILTVNRTLAALRHTCQPQGFNLGANIGQPAGAGIAEHYHFHIVPRWSGDANFMTAISDTRVIPDTLENTYNDLKKAWHELFGHEE
jgi:ATP adenylyltransferase